MYVKLIVITYCISTDFGTALEATATNKGPNFQTYETGPEGSPKSPISMDLSNATDITDSHGELLLDSHEAMNNREATPREKRSFEFLVGLINNNSKYEVLRSDPSPVSPDTSKDDSNDSPTHLLLQLISKIAAYPDNWNKVHQLLRNIDEDLSNSQSILKKQKWIQTHRPSLKRKEGEIRREDDDGGTNVRVQKNFIAKWPEFEESTENTTLKSEAKYGEKMYQKSFAYHKVKGNPTRLKKNTTAYIAVSVVSPKPLNTQSEEDFILETELHRLKPWRNKSSNEKISKSDVGVV